MTDIRLRKREEEEARRKDRRGEEKERAGGRIFQSIVKWHFLNAS